MFTVYYTLIGIVTFFLAAFVLGAWLRRHRTKENAERSSRVMHFFFFAGLVAPPLIAIFYPGLTHFDALLGLPSLPFKSFMLALGIILAIPGLYFMGVTNKLLRSLGSGTNAFILTKRIVDDDIYKRTRNPMSLGFYLCALALAFASSSTFVLLAASLGLIPAHIFFLRYFEELELKLRFGESYLEYRKTVPFLIPRITKGEK
ncbi:MAG: isoprenylcysteine carboxylmethyltransferase family protein [Chloroflexi bacterium]|nr:isoprenylcysteine carboxylmethyltransferase family protein [Chloroflexota bacterium]